MATAKVSGAGITTDVVWAVADHKGVDPIELPSLYSVLDTNALNKLFDSVIRDDTQPACEVKFTYANVDVQVTRDEITIRNAH